MKILLLGIAVFTCLSSFAQDVHFSQFPDAPLQSNPALAGLFTGDMRIQAVNRTQWQSITVPFQTNVINGEFKFSVGKGNDFVTFGGVVFHDQAGTAVLTSTRIMPAFNYHKSLSDSKNLFLSAGFMGGYAERRLDRSKITTDAQYNGTAYVPGSYDGEASIINGYSYLDGAAGITLNGQITDDPNDNFYAGVAVHHFNRPKHVSFYQSSDASLIPMLVFSAGLRTTIDDRSFITIYGEYSKQGALNEGAVGTIYSYKLDESGDDNKYMIEGGTYLRWNDAIIPVVKLARKPFTVGLSYDVTISSLKTFTRGRGGFELSLSYQDFFNNDNSSLNAARCPKF